ncbi:MAG: alpha-mannosidase [Christensenellales bacterium]|jgi:alpha-mannosidase
MKKGFPKALEEKLLALIAKLKQFGVETEFVYKIDDLDPDQACLPSYDDSDWAPLVDRVMQRDQGITWIRAKVTVPDHCEDIPVEGSQLRISAENGHPYFAPLDIYVDGKLILTERSWMDCKCPEGIVSQSAVPGNVHTIAMRFDLNEKCYWLQNFTLQIISDRVKEYEMHIASIIEELKYMEHFKGTSELLEKTYALLDTAANTGHILKVYDALVEARAIFESYREQTKKNVVSLIGHAHIDMNWFWSMEETRDIVKRDFTTMTNLMEKYPDFRFSQSQAATYEIAQEDCPEVFAKMQKYEQEGRWDITASSWVEGDLNMAHGEAIVRHVLYSKEYLKKHFDKLPEIMWCPDTFGHPGTIPQILKKTGLNRYYHMRCGLGVGSRADSGYPDEWAYLRDSKNPPVYWWVGLDGSRVLVVNSQYNRDLDTRGILRASLRMKDFGVDNAMVTYGTGDHGGGPTERDIQWVHVMQEFPTTPTIQFSTTDAYYSYIEAGDFPLLPVRYGEMNFVFDGCYTTHADIKRQNRLCEAGLISVEKLYTIAAQYGVEYPYDELRKYWKKTLFNQFHDILDGSGVKDTYRFTSEEAAEVLGGVDRLTKAAMMKLAEKFGAKDGKAYLIYNPTGFIRNETVELPVEKGKTYVAVDQNGKALLCQVDGEVAKVYVEGIPASGMTIIVLKEDAKEGIKEAVNRIETNDQYYIIKTPLYEVEICKKNGQITTLYDIKRDWYIVRREQIGWRLKKGVLNSLQVHMEEPTAMSSWTIGNVRTVHNLLDGAESEIICDGEVESRIRFTHHFMDSTIWQDIIVRSNEPEIRFETKVEWNEWGDFDRDAPMLRAYFAPDIQDTSKAAYEIPFGVIERPCMDNEYPALNWIDMSDEKHGFALLNDCKYGHKCRGNAMELTLIRSGWLPDQTSDIGIHEFTYAILPHCGDWQKGNVIAAGQAMNQQIAVTPACGTEPACGSLIEVEGGVLSNVKRAEAGDGMILRIYQPTNQNTNLVIRLKSIADNAEEMDMLEKKVGDVEIVDSCIYLPLDPYEIKTIKIFD